MVRCQLWCDSQVQRRLLAMLPNISPCGAFLSLGAISKLPVGCKATTEHIRTYIHILCIYTYTHTHRCQIVMVCDPSSPSSARVAHALEIMKASGRAFVEPASGQHFHRVHPKSSCDKLACIKDYMELTRTQSA